MGSFSGGQLGLYDLDGIREAGSKQVVAKFFSAEAAKKGERDACFGGAGGYCAVCNRALRGCVVLIVLAAVSVASALRAFVKREAKCVTAAS